MMRDPDEGAAGAALAGPAAAAGEPGAEPDAGDRGQVGFVGSSARHYELGPIALALLKRNVPVDAELAEKVRQLCVKLGYFGSFEVEFIRAGGRQLLIDFNPRFYSQMGFDIARGMPLPLFVYEARWVSMPSQRR